MSDRSQQEEKRYIDGTVSSSSSKATRHISQQHQQQGHEEQSQTLQPLPDPSSPGQETDSEPPSKRQRIPSGHRTSLPLRPASTWQSTTLLSTKLTSSSRANEPDDMSDGKNEARALRVLEIMNDFRTLQVHIATLVGQPEATAPNQASYNLIGYSILRQCTAEATAILATVYNPGNLGFADPAQVPATEVQKTTLQRIILDASTRRFQAHKIYLRVAACMRWARNRKAALTGGLSPQKQAQELHRIDARLQSELSDITDEAVVSDLRNADSRKNYWLAEDPSLERMLAWIRRQR